MPHKDPAKNLAYHKQYYQSRKAAGVCVNCGKNAPCAGNVSCRDCLERQKAKIAELRIEAMVAYGGLACKCCGEHSHPAFLTIDHTESARYHSRRKRGEKVPSGNNLLFLLRKQGWPAGFQVLCWNCNYGKSIYGICPHQTANLPQGEGA